MFFVLFFLAALSISTLQAQEFSGANSFSWLVGTWEKIHTKPGESAFEVWEMQPDYLSGIGVTLRGADTVFVEHLKIISRDGAYYYVAEVSHNPAPVLFRITEISETGFISENPVHDFPKKIQYNLSAGILTATIAAGNKQIPFKFRRNDP